ncbi:M28 family peptidase [Polyangium mundeleinium]|uniref:M28 family peptidase n=1 Tax=Polyangium mundeleinium TaxID=2995306 RepID=A0ABT5EY72_9BACT|nr:M28 family peptidase [Polyangium mundeleinium]MDC0746780.1 M28 family peptidase [Polyangium mundeleinium]
MRIWIAIAALLVLAVELTMFAERLPTPRPASAPPTEFSAERAMVTLRGLTDLGTRVSGTPSARAAAERLAAELRTLPGVEVEVQEAAGTRQFTDTPFPYSMFAYRTINVIGRLPGRSRDAVLLNAHDDTTGSSFGAGDDAFGVAAIMETMRRIDTLFTRTSAPARHDLTMPPTRPA